MTLNENPSKLITTTKSIVAAQNAPNQKRCRNSSVKLPTQFVVCKLFKIAIQVPWPPAAGMRCYSCIYKGIKDQCDENKVQLGQCPNAWQTVNATRRNVKTMQAEQKLTFPGLEFVITLNWNIFSASSILHLDSFLFFKRDITWNELF